MYAIKQAVLAKEHVHELDPSIFYMDIRAYGKGFEEFYERARNEFDIKFIRGSVSEIVENHDTNNLIIRVEDTETEELLEQEFDMIVLSTALIPPHDSKLLEQILGVSRTVDGFFDPLDLQLSSVMTSAGRIFIAGVAEGPKDIPDSIAQASAAAMKAAIPLIRS